MVKGEDGSINEIRTQHKKGKKRVKKVEESKTEESESNPSEDASESQSGDDGEAALEMLKAAVGETPEEDLEMKGPAAELEQEA